MASSGPLLPKLVEVNNMQPGFKTHGWLVKLYDYA